MKKYLVLFSNLFIAHVLFCAPLSEREVSNLVGECSVGAFFTQECLVCLVQKDVFRVLKSCGHSVCEICLKTMLTADGRSATCPLCRKNVFTGQEGAPRQSTQQELAQQSRDDEEYIRREFHEEAGIAVGQAGEAHDPQIRIQEERDRVYAVALQRELEEEARRAFAQEEKQQLM